MSNDNFPSNSGGEEGVLSQNSIISVHRMHKWDVYHRLKALDIDCHCQTDRPLSIELNTTQTAIQVWSIIKHLTASRQESIDWLNRCWQLP
jgi:hypothetical protein